MYIVTVREIESGRVVDEFHYVEKSPEREGTLMYINIGARFILYPIRNDQYFDIVDLKGGGD